MIIRLTLKVWVFFVNRDVELLKGVTRNMLEVLEVNCHTLDRLIVVQEGHEIAL